MMIISAVICLNIYLIHPMKAKGRNMMTKYRGGAVVRVG
jgi:hypothetical protein